MLNHYWALLQSVAAPHEAILATGGSTLGGVLTPRLLKFVKTAHSLKYVASSTVKDSKDQVDNKDQVKDSKDQVDSKGQIKDSKDQVKDPEIYKTWLQTCLDATVPSLLEQARTFARLPEDIKMRDDSSLSTCTDAKAAAIAAQLHLCQGAAKKKVDDFVEKIARDMETQAVTLQTSTQPGTDIVDLVARIQAASEVTKDLKNKALRVVSGKTTKTMYEAYKEWESVKDVIENLEDRFPISDQARDCLKGARAMIGLALPAAHDCVATLTCVQALWRPLKEGETPAKLISSARANLRRRKITHRIPALLHPLIFPPTVSGGATGQGTNPAGASADSQATEPPTKKAKT